jgi:Domain of unknown function (DUF3883)
VQSLSPGVAFGCIELLGVVKRNHLTPGGVHSLSLGSVSSAAIYRACLELAWIEVQPDGLLSVTVRGERAAIARSPQAGLRTMLVDFIEVEQPPWLQLVPYGRRETLLQAPPGVRQVFVEAGLAYGDDDETVRFWDALAARARGLRDGALTEIGRRGERLTLQYERHRTGVEPKWIALEASSDGYDVLSRVSMSDTRRMTIEVKTSEQSVEFALFHLTRNEWENACCSSAHRFHLWSLTSSKSQLAVLTVEQVWLHVPSDRCSGIWKTVSIPFAAFQASFTECAGKGHQSLLKEALHRDE